MLRKNLKEGDILCHASGSAGWLYGHKPVRVLDTLPYKEFGWKEYKQVTGGMLVKVMFLEPKLAPNELAVMPGKFIEKNERFVNIKNLRGPWAEVAEQLAEQETKKAIKQAAAAAVKEQQKAENKRMEKVAAVLTNKGPQFPGFRAVSVFQWAIPAAANGGTTREGLYSVVVTESAMKRLLEAIQ